MPNLSQNLSGITATSLNITGDAIVGGKATAAGFRSSIAGTLADCAFGWTTGVHASGPTSGLIHEGTRVGMEYNGADKAYWGSINHNYAVVQANAGLLANSTTTSAGNRVAIASKTATFTPSDIEEVLLCDSTSGAITVNLPTAASNRQRYVIKKTVASANAVTIDPSGTQTIDGAATLAVPNNTCITIVSDGSNWHTISLS